MQLVLQMVRSDTPDEMNLICLRLLLNEKFETIKALDADSEVTDLIDSDSIADDIERANESKEAVFSSLLAIDLLIKKLKPPSSRKGLEVSEMATHISQSSMGKASKAIIAFNFRWPLLSLINNNEQLSEIEKFNLNSLLEHSAREAISEFALTAAKYHEAISTPKKRFGKK